MKLRISHVWEQNASGNNKVPYGYGYGKEYRTSTDILTQEHDQTKESHGTHVLGIAGGSSVGNGSTYLGVAPDAELIVVSMKGSNVATLEGIDYIFRLADSLNKPAVVNLSLGTHIGPHDGYSSFDYVLSTLVKAGRIVVGAAGNEGSDSLHIQYTFSNTDTTIFAFMAFRGGYSATGGSSILDIWGESKKDFEVSINLVNLNTGKFEDYTPYYKASTSNGSISRELFDSDNVPDTAFVYGATGVNPLNGKPNAQFYLEHNQYHDYQWLLLEIKAKSGTVHAWLNSGTFPEISGYNTAPFVYGNTDYTVGEIGGTAKDIITVGAYTTTNSYRNFNGNTQTIGSYASVGEIAPFSSLGPTVDKRTKPDITAPGNVILSSVNSFDPNYTTNSNNVVGGATNGKKNWLYAALEGTSMATPFTAGVVALMLETYPQLTFAMVKKELSSNAKTDSYTGTIASGGSNTWGWGKINAGNIISNMISDIPDAPILSITSDTFHACQGETVKFYITKKDNRTTGVEWSDKSTKDTILISKNATYKVRIRTNQGYFSDWSKPVVFIFHEKPFAAITPPITTSYCVGDSANLKSDSLNALYQYQWTRNDTNIANANKAEIWIKTGGKYKLFVTDRYACKDSTAATQIDFYQLPSLAFDPALPKQLCENATFNANVSNKSGDLGSFDWYINGIKNSNTSNQLTVSGNSTIYVKGTTSIGCINTTDTVTINMVKLPNMVISAPEGTKFCDGSSVNLILSGFADTTAWYFGGSRITTNQDTLMVTEKGSYYVIGSNQGICHDTSNTINIDILSKPSANISLQNNTSFCEGGQTTLSLDNPDAEIYYFFKDGKQIDQNTTATFVANETGSYYIQSKAANGCINESRRIIITKLEKMLPLT